MKRMRLIGFLLVLAVSTASAVTFAPFTPTGEGGKLNNHQFSIAGSDVFEMEAFFSIEGQDLNGSHKGVSAKLSRDSLPAGLDYSFVADLNADSSNLTLTYTFDNQTGAPVAGAKFFSFIDLDASEESNTFFNEYVLRAQGASLDEADPDFWQADEPGFKQGTIYDNLLNGILNNSAAMNISNPDDASMAIGFDLAEIPDKGKAEITILISENGAVLGNLSFEHIDTDGEETPFTFSGSSLVTSGQHWLDVEINGSGSLNIQDAFYDDGSIVELRAAASLSSLFQGWTGDVPAGSEMDNPIFITMDQAKFITANFTADTIAPEISLPGHVTLEYPGDLSPENTGWASGIDVTSLAEFEGHYYEFVDAFSNIAWTTAALIAEEKDGLLVQVTSSNENAFVTSNMLGKSWMGSTDALTEGDWLNVDGTAVVFTNWADGEPAVNDIHENYLALNVETNHNGGTWLDLPDYSEGADGVRFYIVEYTSLVSIAYTDEVISTSPGSYQTVQRVWSATDLNGNTSLATQLIELVDTSAPEFDVVPEDATAEAGAVSPAPEVTASDNSGESIDVEFSETVENAVNTGHYDLVRTWTATDSTGNSISVEQCIEVRDTTAPVLSGVPANIVAEVGSVPPAATVAVTDNSGEEITPVFAEVTTNEVNAGHYDLVRTWTATDASGNATTGVQVILVRDTTSPELRVPVAATLEAGEGCSATYTGPLAVATDAGDPAPVISSSPSIPAIFTGIGEHTIIWTATDESGNAATCTQTITLQDTLAPVLSGVPEDETHEYGSVPAAPTVTATDNSGAQIDVILVEDPVTTTSHEYVLTRTWTAADPAGNSVSESQQITVVDTTAPVITSITVSPDNLWPAMGQMQPVEISISVSDGGDEGAATSRIIAVTANEPISADDWNISDDLELELRAESTSVYTGRVYQIFVEAADCYGNSSTGVVEVSVLQSSPKATKLNVVAEMEAALASIDNKVAARLIQKALGYVENSVEDKYWIDELYLTQKGQKVFVEEGKAAHELLKLLCRTNDPEIEAMALIWIEDLVAADRDIAAAAIELAQQRMEAEGDQVKCSVSKQWIRDIRFARISFACANYWADRGCVLQAIHSYKVTWHFTSKVIFWQKHSCSPHDDHGCDDDDDDNDDDHCHKGKGKKKKP